MTHRADQIIDAIVSRLQASVTLGIALENVFAHRTLSLAEDQGELPAITVNFGDDVPNDEYTILSALIGSTLEVLTVAYLTGDNEHDLKRALVAAARTETQKAINLRETLDLDFVIKVEYGGARAPELNAEAELMAGAQESRWLVTYQMNPDDPS